MENNPFINQLVQVWDGFNSLTGLAVLVAIFITTTAKEYMTSKDRVVPVYQVRVVAFFVAMTFFVALCWWTGEDLRNRTVVFNAVGAGIAGPGLVWAAKKCIGVDLDEIMAGIKPPKDPPLPPPTGTA